MELSLKNDELERCIDMKNEVLNEKRDSDFIMEEPKAQKAGVSSSDLLEITKQYTLEIQRVSSSNAELRL